MSMSRNLVASAEGRIRSPRLPGGVYRVFRGAEGLSLNLLDVGVVSIAWGLAIVAANRAASQPLYAGQIFAFVAIAMVIQVLVQRLAGMYGPVWQYASVDEAVRVTVGIIAGAAAATVAVTITSVLTGWHFPVSTAPPLASLLSLLGCGGIRFQARLYAAVRSEKHEEVDQLRTVIVGAGAAGASLAHELKTTEARRSVKVVGFVDVDEALVGRSVRGIRVLGPVDELHAVCIEHDVDRVLITTSMSQPALRSTLARALSTKAQVKVLPPSSERAGGALVGNLRDLDVTDLLGRDPAPVDNQEIGAHLYGATVLVTGAGGSIGSEIARQVATFGPARLLVLDRDETLLHDLMAGPLAGSDADPVLGDIGDTIFMDRIFARYRPDVVFHAAAQKHVPILEEFPAEAVRVNVLGTLTLAETAARHNCRRFVHISTDKAADPCSVMGASKRAAEQVIFEIGKRHDMPFVAVRFGNVLASRGSVVPTFLRQILEGGPVTVTDAEMTRYFMTIPEAVSLVLQAGAMASAGRIFLLDMGEPVSILKLASQMIRLAGLRPDEDIAIKIVGIRPGERLHERLHDDAEVVHPTSHPSINSLEPKVSWDWEELSGLLRGLQAAVLERDDEQVVAGLEHLLRTAGIDCTLDGPHRACETSAPPQISAMKPIDPATPRRRADDVPLEAAPWDVLGGSLAGIPGNG